MRQQRPARIPASLRHTMPARRWRRSAFLAGGVTWLGLALAAASSAARLCAAQTPGPDTASARRYHLAVRPREMATGTRTDRAGEYQLDSLDRYWAYVPPQCVGTTRCPLVVFLHGAGLDGRATMKWLPAVWDKYGMIGLAPSGIGGGWGDDANIANMEVALRQVLRKFAVDPDRIALVGASNGGVGVRRWGVYNPEIFNRLALYSAGLDPEHFRTAPAANTRANKQVEYYMSYALHGEVPYGIPTVPAIRRKGYRIKDMIDLREHDNQVEGYDHIGQWLAESWAKPDAAGRRAPDAIYAIPLLTPDAVSRVAAFWERFMQEPDSIRVTARRRYLREVTVPVGKERPSVLLVDMAALAAASPSVAADFRAAGLTPQLHDAYRIALVSAYATMSALDGVFSDGAFSDMRSRRTIGPVDKRSVLGKNVAFIVHDRPKVWLSKEKIWWSLEPNLWSDLEKLGFWNTP